MLGCLLSGIQTSYTVTTTTTKKKKKKKNRPQGQKARVWFHSSWRHKPAFIEESWKGGGGGWGLLKSVVSVVSEGWAGSNPPRFEFSVTKVKAAVSR